MPMDNVIKYSSNYSETTESLSLCSKDETSDFNNDIANTDNCKSFEYKSRSLEMLPITRKVELKLKQTKYCILSAVATDNVNGNHNANNIGFTIKVTNLYVPVVTSTARDNQKLSKPLS